MRKAEWIRTLSFFFSSTRCKVKAPTELGLISGSTIFGSNPHSWIHQPLQSRKMPPVPASDSSGCPNNFALGTRPGNIVSFSKKSMSIARHRAKKLYELRNQRLANFFSESLNSNALQIARRFFHDIRWTERWNLQCGTVGFTSAHLASIWALVASHMYWSHFPVIALSTLQGCCCTFLNPKTSFFIALYSITSQRYKLLLDTIQNVTFLITIVQLPPFAHTFPCRGSFWDFHDILCMLYDHFAWTTVLMEIITAILLKTKLSQLSASRSPFFDPARSAILDCLLDWLGIVLWSHIHSQSREDRYSPETRHLLHVNRSSRYFTLIDPFDDITLWINELFVSGCLKSMGEKLRPSWLYPEQLGQCDFLRNFVLAANSVSVRQPFLERAWGFKYKEYL